MYCSPLNISLINVCTVDEIVLDSVLDIAGQINDWESFINSYSCILSQVCHI